MHLSKIIDGKKFMWDGCEYNDENTVAIATEKYKSSNFETRLINENNKFYIFTRKMVTEVKVEGSQPI
jgi:hypothetical protein